MSNDRSDIIICRDCGIVISRDIRIMSIPLEINDIVLFGKCPSCKEK